MNLGQRILVKHQDVVQEGKVIKIFEEELDIELENGEIIRRKFWETRAIKGTTYEKKE
jgi:hypothetical protein